MYLDDDAWHQAQTGWYFNHERKQVQIKYPQPSTDYAVVISYLNPGMIT